MSTATMPTTVHMKRRHLVGVVVATAAVAATVAATITAVTNDASPPRATPTREQVLASISPDARRYVEGVEALTPLQRAAAYGNKPLDALGLEPQARQYVEGIMALTPEQLAAGFGNVGLTVSKNDPGEQAFVDGITGLTPEQLAAAYGNVPLPSDARPADTRSAPTQAADRAACARSAAWFTRLLPRGRRRPRAIRPPVWPARPGRPSAS